jgi:hypothetical protein
VTAPFRFVIWLFKTWNWYIAFGVMAVITGMIVLIVITATSHTTTPAATAAAESVTIPSAITAPYLVQTSSRYYYAGQVTQSGPDYIIKSYWYLDLSSQKWVKSPDPLDLSPNYGKITVTKR